jgi:hypothetical protein
MTEGAPVSGVVKAAAFPYNKRLLATLPFH